MAGFKDMNANTFIETLRAGEIPGRQQFQRFRQEQDLCFENIVSELDRKFAELLSDYDNDFKKPIATTRITRTSKAVSKSSRASRATNKLPTFSDTTFVKPASDVKASICSADLQLPLNSSTPTEEEKNAMPLTELEQNIIRSPINVNVLPTPKTPDTSKPDPTKSGESVKKRILEFEKKQKEAAESASKIPVITPIKSKNMVHIAKNLTNQMNQITPSKIYIDLPGHKITRNISKILKEKNAITTKVPENVYQEAGFKKPVPKKCQPSTSSAESKMKSEVLVKNSNATNAAILKKKLILAKSSEDKKEKKKKDEADKVESYNIDCVSDGAQTDEEDSPLQEIPTWAKKENRKHALNVQAYIDRATVLRPWFTNSRLKHPKMEELFSDKVKTRPRTSSAVWNQSYMK